MVNKKNEKINFGERELLKPMYDVVFQSLFNIKNKNITKNMLSALLEEEITEIKINETKELFREYPEDKLGILDLEAKINNKEIIDVEIQLVDRKNLAERLLRYFSKLYSIQIQKGSDYKEAKRVVIVAIINYEYELTKEIKNMETIWNLRERNHPNLILTDKIEIRIINLMKVKSEYIHNSKNKKAQWMMFLKDPNCEEVKMLVKENKEIKEAVVEVIKMSEDEKIRKLAELREKALLDEKDIFRAGQDKGKKSGIIEGEKNEREKIAKQMLKMGLSIRQICQATKLSEEEINKIK